MGRNVTKDYKDFRVSKKAMSHSKILNFIQDLPITAQYDKIMYNGQIGNNALSEILRQRNTLYTNWADFNRRPKKLVHEQYICVLKGQENYKLVSPIFRKNIYVGVLEKFKQHETPMDFFTWNPRKWRLARQAKFIDVTLNAGDCMYVPAYYYIQSHTTYQADNQESIILT